MLKNGSVPTKPCHACNGTGVENFGPTKIAILAILQKKPGTALEIEKAMRRNGAISRDTSYMTGLVRVHKSLKRLIDDGLVRKRPQRQKRGEAKRLSLEFEVVG